MKNIVVILAGGTGSRLGLGSPKQFFKVAGKTVLEHTVEIFEKNVRIDEIYIVAHSSTINNLENLLLLNKWKKVSKIISGGQERADSSLAAINACEEIDANLIFHDAVRPLVSNRIVDEVIDALSDFNAIDVAIPAVDTIVEVENNKIFSIPDRSRLYRGQTPQAFKLSTIKFAYQKALKDSFFKVTDDCGVVKKYLPDEPIYIIRGDESNMKLTHKEDIFLMDKLFQLKSDIVKSELLLDRLKDKVVVVFGGSYGIGADIVHLANLNMAKSYSFSRSLNNVDISNYEDINNALNSVFELEGKIDYIVNSAALLYKEPLMNMERRNIDSIIDVNYKGMVNVALCSYKFLKESKGALLFFTSSSYTRGRSFYSLYSSTKAAVVNFVQAISQEWEIDGIRVNCINPERTLTPMRLRNFGNEPKNTLLSSEAVAIDSIKTLLSNFTGQVVDVKL